jgi:ketosteroid isomerase-like protein
MPHSPEVQNLLDEQAIRNVLFDYCRGVDRCDAEAIRATYHEDGTDDHGVFTGTATDFVAWVVPFLLKNYLSHMHPLSNIRIRIDGDVARAESYVTPVLRRKTDSGEYLDCSGGRYIDRLERRNGRWKIAHRTFVRDWRETRKVAPAAAPDAYQWGVRSREDLSYR